MHTNTITGKSYIGITQYGIMKRWYQHITAAIRYNSVFAFHRAIRKHGKQVWAHTVLHSSIQTKDQAETLEIAMIEKYNTFIGGYNSTAGGKLPYTQCQVINSKRMSTNVRPRQVRSSEKFWFYNDQLGTDYQTRQGMITKYTLHKSSLNKVVAGDRNHHKGWKVIHATPNKG